MVKITIHPAYIHCNKIKKIKHPSNLSKYLIEKYGNHEIVLYEQTADILMEFGLLIKDGSWYEFKDGIYYNNKVIISILTTSVDSDFPDQNTLIQKLMEEYEENYLSIFKYFRVIDFMDYNFDYTEIGSLSSIEVPNGDIDAMCEKYPLMRSYTFLDKSSVIKSRLDNFYIMGSPTDGMETELDIDVKTIAKIKLKYPNFILADKYKSIKK